MRNLMLLFLLVACGPRSADTPDLNSQDWLAERDPDLTLPPPTSISLEGPAYVPVYGEFEIIVPDALAEEAVYLIVGGAADDGGYCPRPLGGYCLGVTRPSALVATASADGDGRARFTLTAPRYEDARHCYQAAIPRGPVGIDSGLSNVICVDFCGASDVDGDGICDDYDPCDGFDDIDSDGDGICDDGDVCEGGDDTIDSDGDGVCDFLDVCEGADDMVDEDGDGRPDDCPGISCSEQATEWCIDNGFTDIHFIGVGNLLCTSPGISPGSDCNACDTGYNTLVWETGSISPYGCGTFSLTAGGLYAGHSPCSCDAMLYECGTWDMEGCIPD